MSHFIKKLIITGIAAVTALGVLTACTKMEESSENGESAAAEEEIPPAEGAEDKEAPAAEDEAAQDAQTDSGTDEGDVSGEAEPVPLWRCWSRPKHPQRKGLLSWIPLDMTFHLSLLWWQPDVRR